MKETKKMTIFFVIFISILFFAVLFFPKEAKKNKNAQIKIGSGEDISGVLMEETVKSLQKKYLVQKDLESSSFQDCCSNAAQWALNAGQINIGFYCNHVAKHTVEQNENVMIYGPVIMNGETVCYRDNWEDVSSIGITQGRDQLKAITRKTYPQLEKFEDITQKGILYTMENGQVDAVILDLTKAAAAPEYYYKPLAEEDYISYVLVVDIEFSKTTAFRDFIKSYNKAVERLNQSSYLAKVLGVNQAWIEKQQIKFLQLDVSKEQIYVNISAANRKSI